MLFKIWFDAETPPPDDAWVWERTQSEVESLLGLNWNRDDTDILLSVGYDGLVLLRQLEVFARFRAIVKPVKIESHIASEELDAAIMAVEVYWGG